MTRIVAILLVVTCFSLQADESLKNRIESFLKNYCLDCHDDLTSKAGLDLTSLSWDLSDPVSFSAWEKVEKRVSGGEMPPPKKKNQPSDAERATLSKALKPALVAAEQAEVRKRGRVHLRRLTRLEYERSLHDLLGVDIPLQDFLPADETPDGFETKAENQQVSLFHLRQYLDAADAALDEAFRRAMKGDRTFKKFYSPQDLTHDTGRGNYRGPEARDGKVISWSMGVQFSGRMTATRVPEEGWYKITIKNLEGVNLGPDGAVWGTLRSGSCYSNEPLLYYIASVEAAAEPRDHTYLAWIRDGHMLEFKPNEGGAKRAGSGGRQGGTISYRGRDLEKQGYMGLRFEGIEIERIYPNAPRWQVRRNILPGLEKADLNKPDFGAKATLKRLVREFAAQAFRRPVSPEEAAPYQELGLAEMEKGKSVVEAIKTGYRAILCSPRFLTFIEEPGELDGFSVATRLSYAFWNSLPDGQLRRLAKDGSLLKDEVLIAEANRLLNHPNGERFVESFSDQWLELSQINFTQPDRRKFPTFDPIVQDSMVQETRAFLKELIVKDLPVSNLVVSDFAMLNTRLKYHYGLRDVDVNPGQGLQKVALRNPELGGIVTHGSIMKVTADGAVTSPVLRGVWVNERILGLEVPPPPPNVPAVEPDIRGATSIREQLAKHRSDESCAACHRKIDPAGFALERFDPVGRIREFYGRPGKSARVDASGVTPDGVEFTDYSSWKKIYADRPEQLAKAFVHHFLTYATGASPGLSDEPEIERIVHEAAKQDYGLRSLILASLQSGIFKQK